VIESQSQAKVYGIEDPGLTFSQYQGFSVFFRKKSITR